MRFITHFIIWTMTATTAIQAQCLEEVVYFDIEQMTTEGTSFYLPQDGNEWLRSKAIHSSFTGFFSYTCDISTVPGSTDFAKEWKCPYCNRFWPWGQPCGNANCPSKFKG